MFYPQFFINRNPLDFILITLVESFIFILHNSLEGMTPNTSPESLLITISRLFTERNRSFTVDVFEY